ncbi:MAG: hypothetical protein WCH46_04505 [bacterium]
MRTRLFGSLVAATFIVASFFCVGNAKAQRSSSFNNDISLDFIDQLINNILSIQYEFKTSSTSSIAIRAAFVTPVSGSSAFGAGGAWRFYINDSRALSGMSVGPAAEIFFFKNNDLSKNNMVISIGGDFAYKFFFDQFTVEPMIGGRLGFTGTDVIPGVNTFTTLHVVGAVNLGWAW